MRIKFSTMKLQIRNIGQIREAEIDLSKDFIVLCGANNTGKTYLAYTVYGLYKYAKLFRELAVFEDFILDVPVEDLFEKGSINLNIEKLFLANEKRIIDFLNKHYPKYLSVVFSVNEDFFADSQIKVELDRKSAIQKLFSIQILQGIVLGDFSLDFHKKKDNSTLLVSFIKDKKQIEFSKRILLNRLHNQLLNIILKRIFNEAYLMPAERLAINIFSTEISEKNTSYFKHTFDEFEEGIRFIKPQVLKYSLPIHDSLNFVKQLKDFQKRKSPYANLADQIEQTILGGKMQTSETGEVQFTPTESKVSLGIHLTASVVKSLASLIFYCRHVAQPNDFLIIDEPELNLHPDNQRKIARVLAQMVNAGIKIMISTHSDYLIRELNNLMMLNVKGEDKKVNQLLKKYGYQKDQILDHNKVGVYLFTDEVKALEVTETGFEVAGIDEEINRLNESAHEIFFTLHDND